jgi:phosphodiesterase/alkaline phosphatase D-like protein
MTETSITSTSVTIQWTLTSPFDPAHPDTFTVTHGENPSNVNMSTPPVTANSSAQTYSTHIKSLEPGTVYFYRLQARNRFEVISTDLKFFHTPAESSKFTVV